MGKNTQTGELQVEVTKVTRPLGGKEETVIKKEDVLMAESDAGEIQTDEEEMTEAQKALPANPATVSVGKNLTMNIGNYESVAVSVHLSMPCQKDDVNEMFKKVNKWVDLRVEAERTSVRRAQNGD